jgi:Uma2 family endonuclease
VLSGTTRQRDRVQKRAFYRGVRIPDYWIVDRETRTVTVVRPDAGDEDVADRLAWHPEGAGEPLIVDVPGIFRQALGDSKVDPATP